MMPEVDPAVLEEYDEWRRDQRMVPRMTLQRKSITPLNEVEEKFIETLEAVTKNDVCFLTIRGRSYGDSWRKRGGVGAFMMLARKWDRIENILSAPPSRTPAPAQYDIFGHATEDTADIMDDIRDLRRYLLLVEGHLLGEGKIGLDEP